MAGGGRPAADPPDGTNDSAAPQDGGNPNDNGDGHAAAHGNQPPRKNPQAVEGGGDKRREREEWHDTGHGADPDDRIRDLRAERLIKGAVSTTSGNVTLGDHYRVTNSFFLTAPSAGDGSSDAPFGPDEVESLLCARVATESEYELARRLRTDDRIALLRGRDDNGRYTSALCALAHVGVPTKDRPLKRVHPSTPFGALADHVDGTACGYLLDASGMGWLGESSETDIAKLRSVLSEHDAHLVVLVDEDDEVGVVRLHSVEHDPPDKRAVLERTLGWFLLPPEAVVPSRADVDTAVAGRVGRLLEQVGTVHGVRSWLRTLESPADASTLARLLSEETERGSAVLPHELEARVAEVRTAHLRSRARELLRSASSAHSPIDQAYVIAAAVLDGCTLATVIEAAEGLADRLQQAELPEGKWRRRTFARPLARRLRHVETEQRDTGADGSTDTIVVLKQPQLRNVLVDVVWQEYEAARRPLRKWLVQLCERSWSEFPDDWRNVQIGGGIALARLAEHDFSEIATKVLEPWAHLRSPLSGGEDLSRSERQRVASDVGHCRRVVAWVVEQLVVGGTQRSRALNLLETWMRESDRSPRNTAVLAFGTRVAEIEPKRVSSAIEDALQRLDQDFARDDPLSARGSPPGHIVAAAVEGAFDAGMRYQALRLLTAKASSLGPAATLAAVQALLRIASLKERDGDDVAAPRTERPALLAWLDTPRLDAGTGAGHDSSAPDVEVLTEGIARLWAIALAMRDDKHLKRRAWSVLHLWDAFARSPDTGSPGFRARMNRLLEYLRRAEPGLREEIAHYEKVRDRIAAHRGAGTDG
ncbi:hypothetical protein EFW17_07270 [Halostreptopolyspora alba]|uniref:Uncharacterized protein n=1 Tax=Halostreptopolyspora alba TaxID=2487137 RepID=A0A3N0ED36_9ACTN|nr:hypothetical protein EFW17_07270 [Nocardiopsaceae bacterium YIM 96095]